MQVTRGLMILRPDCHAVLTTDWRPPTSAERIIQGALIGSAAAVYVCLAVWCAYQSPEIFATCFATGLVIGIVGMRR